MRNDVTLIIYAVHAVFGRDCGRQRGNARFRPLLVSLLTHTRASPPSGSPRPKRPEGKKRCRPRGDKHAMLSSLPFHTFRPVRRIITSSFATNTTSRGSSSVCRQFTTHLSRRPSSSTTSMAPSLLALAASAGNSITLSELTLHKLQGAQLFVGSGVAFLFAAHRWQVRMEGKNVEEA